ncbi:MAG: YdiU family protein [SAR324 cluster bacterium]|nr:YdiU family protein [SAR324 cluster bacterium]
MTMIQFSNSYDKLPSAFFAQVAAAPFPEATLLAFNHDLAEELGLDLSNSNSAELAKLFTGQQIPTSSNPIATVYAGHQFGSFSPQLGDGRALLLGEILTPKGERFDIQLKGSGDTPYSRNGDGRSSLGPVIREYIVSEAMHHLGVPTTRALAACMSGEKVFREKPLPGGVFTRVASSHIRIGTFEYFANQGDLNSLKTLLDYSINRHYPEIAKSESPVLAFIEEVAKAQANMVAHWLSFGFIHGVMNTDNMSISGETLDFGPCAFVDNFSHSKVFSSIDRYGRYAYSNQIPVAKWNLYRLANCLLPLVDEREQIAVSKVQDSLASYLNVYEDQWLEKMAKKLGLFEVRGGDDELVRQFLTYLEEEDLDFTLSFRELSLGIDQLNESSEILTQSASFADFLQNWQARLQDQSQSRDDSKKLMDSVNPIFIPRNHRVEEAIQLANTGILTPFTNLNKLLKNPFTEQSEFKHFAKPPMPSERIQATFCGT